MSNIRIAISSDNHLDVNRINIKQALAFQSNWLNKKQVDYYLFAGDLFNDFVKTQRYFEQLQRLTAGTKIFYIIGNHDMLNNISFAEMEHPRFPAYIHNQFVDIPNSNWRIIGNNDWYDYSFSSYYGNPTRVRSWKNVYWLDSSIDQPLTDQQRMRLVLEQVRTQLHDAKLKRKQVLFITHFAPRHELLAPKPRAVNTPRREHFYQMINAMMGSDQLGKLLEVSGVVKDVFYGHLHGIHPPLTRNGVTYFNQAVGVNNKRINEWQANDFFSQWQRTLRIINL